MRIKLVVLSACVIGCLTGCGNVIADMTDTESEQISEYAAALLLAYDKDYHSRLLNEEEMVKAEEEEAIAQARAEEARRIAEQSMKEEEQASEEGTDSDAADAEGQAGEKEAVALADFLELTGFDVQYAGMSVEDAYPSDSGELTDDTGAFFAMRANAGNKLLVLKLNVTNTSGQDQTLDLLSKNVRFTVNGASIGKKSTLVTMLDDDFSVYSGNIAAGASVQTVLITEIKAEQADDVGALSLGVKYNDASTIIALQ